MSIDTLRSDHLAVYGYPFGATPAIDALRRDAMLFESAWSPVPLTVPSHLSAFTGLLPPHHGVRDNGGFVLPADIPTLAERLRAAHYDTAAFVSAGVLAPGSGVERGFEVFDVPGEGGIGAYSERPGAATVAVAISATVSWVLTTRWRRRDPEAGGARFPAAVFLAVAAAGAGVGAIWAFARFLPLEAMAPVRTLVLAAAAVGLAALSNRTGEEAAGWLAWAVLAAAALRVLLQDLPAGRPLPLFAGFVLCGLALLAVSSLGKRPDASSGQEARS